MGPPSPGSCCPWRAWQMSRVPDTCTSGLSRSALGGDGQELAKFRKSRWGRGGGPGSEEGDSVMGLESPSHQGTQRRSWGGVVDSPQETLHRAQRPIPPGGRACLRPYVSHVKVIPREGTRGVLAQCALVLLGVCDKPATEGGQCPIKHACPGPTALRLGQQASGPSQQRVSDLGTDLQGCWGGEHPGIST
jgi:hypothetical protein